MWSFYLNRLFSFSFKLTALGRKTLIFLLHWNLLVSQFSSGHRFPSETQKEQRKSYLATLYSFAKDSSGEGKKDNICDTK